MSTIPKDLQSISRFESLVAKDHARIRNGRDPESLDEIRKLASSLEITDVESLTLKRYWAINEILISNKTKPDAQP